MNFHAQFLAQKRFGSLDGLRTVSILAVIWHHTAPAWVGETLAHVGAQGVTLFFAISGFLITTLLLRERERNAGIDLKAFYVRRTLRIFPLYFGVLALYVAVVALLERNTLVGQAFFSNLIYFATFTTNLFVPLDGRVIFYFAWSLAAEEQFYLLWPSVLLLMKTPGRAAWLLLGVSMAGIAGQLIGNRFFSAIPLSIVVGALLAMALHTERGFGALHQLLGWRGAPVALAMALVVGLGVVSVPAFINQILFAALVGACVITEKHALARLLAVKPIAYVGAISYGMYMFHMLCKNTVVKLLGVLQWPTQGLAVFTLTLVLSLIVAAISFKYYESFFVKITARPATP
jgi:peptidoglycan/LPS O-acetylase OafA/YrhL